ncbi:MAG: ribose 5-phosphate isomerase B [Chloroflexota bacterium]
MRIAVGADHAGYDLKRELRAVLDGLGHEWQDFSPETLDPEDDYPDVATRVARAVAGGTYDRGILICGTGVGVSIAANKVAGVRAALCGDTFSAHSAREHNDANVLCLGARVTGAGLGGDIVRAFLAAEFSQGARHRRRIDKMMALDADRPDEPAAPTCR